jgi:hypothetical protein
MSLQTGTHDPSDLAGLLARLRTRGVPVEVPGPANVTPLDRSTRGRGKEGIRRRKKDGKKTKKPLVVLHEHRQFASDVIGSIPEEGALLFVTLGTPTPTPRETLHHRFARFCRRHGWGYVILLDWGEDGAARVPGDPEGNGEHLHALVWTHDRKRFVETVHPWAHAEGIDRRVRKWKAVTGWPEYVTGETTKLLETNIAKVLAYMTKPPPKDGYRRDLGKHARASGIFRDAWNHFVCNATASTSRSVSLRRCRDCGGALPAGATVRRLFCDSTCRLRSHRGGSRATRAWLIRPCRRRRRVLRFTSDTPRGGLYAAGLLRGPPRAGWRKFGGTQ